MNNITACLWCGSKELELIAHRKDGVGVLKCKNCRLFMNQQIPKNLEDYYNEEYFNTTQTDFESGYEGVHYLVSPAFLIWQNSFIEEIDEKHLNKEFLEIGAATGNLLEILRENQDNLSLSGIDISKYAVDVATKKGFNVELAHIEKYKAKSKKDIIFSSETMEHLDNLKSFLNGVSDNLDKDGVFLFYVPSISEKDAEKEKDDYIRFNVNMEHLLHFSPEFFINEFSKFFNGKTLIKEFNTNFGPSIIGAVSRNASNLKQLEKLFVALDTNEIPAKSSDMLLKNIAIISLKFSQFELYTKVAAEIKKRKSFEPRIVSLIEGLASYHRGELENASNSFQEYLKDSPDSRVALELLLTNEKELNSIYRDQIDSYKNEIDILHNSRLELAAKEAEIKDLRQSKIVGSAIKVRKGVGATLDPVRRFQKKNLKAKAYSFVPPKLRGPVRYTLNRKWRIKHIEVDNKKPAEGIPLVSVVIPYYNRADTIDETVNSLKKQTYQNFDVILVDDGSTDGPSIQKLKKLDLSNLRAQIIHQKNAGVASARNNGISHARGEYIICLDSDDYLDPTYIEKCLLLLETDPNIDLATTDMNIFGVNNLTYKQGNYSPTHLLDNNMVVTAAMFKKTAWEKVGGYKSDIGYEDWEFWVNLAENGFWGSNIPEPIFNYRTAHSSRYTEDLESHDKNIRTIKELHPNYRKNIKRLLKHKNLNHKFVSKQSLFVNFDEKADYQHPSNKNKNVLITIPWMTFGGAETLIYNYCREVKDEYNISFITGLPSTNEWEYKFKEISPYVYHLANIYGDKELYVEFLSNYIKTRSIDILHIIHNGFTFEMIEEIKHHHSNLKIVTTMFNDRVEYFEPSIEYKKYIDIYTTDNEKVAKSYQRKGIPANKLKVIPNGIDCYTEFNPELINREKMRSELGILEGDLSVFFIGRLSVEKNPDVFLSVAKKIIDEKANQISNMKFFVIGDGPMKGDVERTIKELNNPSVVYLGYQSKVVKYLGAADIFVLPSSIEGFPLSILEAMAMKVAVIASDVGAVSDVIDSGENGIIVQPGSVTDIVKAMHKLADKGRLNTIKENGRKKVEAFYSNKALGDNYKNLYKDLLI